MNFQPPHVERTAIPNGNTLICEADFGRLFEVTAEGELVGSTSTRISTKVLTASTIVSFAHTDIVPRRSPEPKLR
jgi:hypothetical protein